MSKIKNLFATPKKAITTVACVGTALALLGGTTAYAAKAIAVTGAIGSNNALNFAAADAGVDPAAVLLENAEFGFEMGQFVYEVEFNADGMEYDYLIKSSDGTVLKKEAKVEKDNEKVSKPDSGKPVEKKTVADKPVKKPNNAPDKAISLEDAKNKALADAGVAATAAKFTKQKADYDDGVKVFDIEFIVDGIEYEYEINAATGAIRDKSVEVIGGQNNRPVATKKPIAVEQTTKKNQPANSSSGKVIGEQAAKNKALADAGVSASDVKFITARLDLDGGVRVYDVEFRTATHEYEYEINAATGAIRDKSVESFVSATKGDSQPSNGSHIGVDRAKEIAAAKAGVSVNEVVFRKAKLERDDGMTVYEIEFVKDRAEYEFTINAVTGAILESDVDRV